MEIEVVRGDIIAQKDIEAIVNAANANLFPGGGVAGAIHKAAGSQLYEECRSLAPILPGEAVITRAFDLPNKFVIHCLGPVYGKDKPEEELLASCYSNSFRLCEENKISSIAFPAISTGIFGYPPKEAVSVVFNTLLKEIKTLKHLKKIKFVLFSESDLRLYEAKLKEIEADRPI
ncbi:RNase III inhibitor [Christiangramia salexigens]|uniref:RNase III inhibitor n=1 Tax=Christiangramia salexigens TaxID=1913577 RepID=A0A1L3J8M1_9FLAO|nr:RNase III inhibitor [Christiangramia salexigens]